MLSDEQLREIEAAERAATPGPWYVVGPPWGDGSYIVAGCEDPHGGRYVLGIDEMHEETEEYSKGERDWEADLAFAAASRTWVPELLAEVRRQADLLKRCYWQIGRLERDLQELRQEQREQLHDEQEARG